LKIELLVLSFATSLQGAASYPDYRCFTTTRLVTFYLAISAAGLSEDVYNLTNIAASPCMFTTGGLPLSQLGNHPVVRTRRWLVFKQLRSDNARGSSSGRSILELPIHHDPPAALAIIAFLPFSTGAQVTLSKSFRACDCHCRLYYVVVDSYLQQRRNRSQLAAGVFDGFDGRLQCWCIHHTKD